MSNVRASQTLVALVAPGLGSVLLGLRCRGSRRHPRKDRGLLQGPKNRNEPSGLTLEHLKRCIVSTELSCRRAVHNKKVLDELRHRCMEVRIQASFRASQSGLRRSPITKRER